MSAARTQARRYWIGREFWAAGPDAALAELLDVVDARPLYAYVAMSNLASIRVLEKCGFAKVGEHAGDDGIVELLLELRAWGQTGAWAQAERA
jgi:RimJ/RimL family protein N-acetyltransferase